MSSYLFCSLILFGVCLATSSNATEFRPEFIVIHSTEALTPASVKWTNPIYNVPGWKRADGTVEHDVFKVGEVITLANPAAETRDGITRWSSTHDLTQNYGS